MPPTANQSNKLIVSFPFKVPVIMRMTSIKLKVTREDTLQSSAALPAEMLSGDFLTPHVFAPRNSLSSASGKFRTLHVVCIQVFLLHKNAVCKQRKFAKLEVVSYSSIFYVNLLTKDRVYEYLTVL